MGAVALDLADRKMDGRSWTTILPDSSSKPAAQQGAWPGPAAWILTLESADGISCTLHSCNSFLGYTKGLLHPCMHNWAEDMKRREQPVHSRMQAGILKSLLIAQVGLEVLFAGGTLTSCIPHIPAATGMHSIKHMRYTPRCGKGRARFMCSLQAGKEL